MRSMEDRCKEMIGSSIVVRDKDYGTVASYYSIHDGSFVRFIFVTDMGHSIEAGSYFRFISDSKLRKFYPQGTDYAKRFSGPSAKSHRIEYVPSNSIHNIANCNYNGNNKRGGN